MSHSLQALPHGPFTLHLSGEPSYCRSLVMAPSRRESELEQGAWLVLVFAVWSIYDIQAIDKALALAKNFGGRIRLGLRPFNDYQEIATWCPESQAAAAARKGLAAQWLVLRDGRLLSALPLMAPETEILEAVEPALAPTTLAQTDSPMAMPLTHAT